MVRRGNARPVITIPVSHGELIDKICILTIKQQQLHGDAHAHVSYELQMLQEVESASGLTVEPALRQQLSAVNTQLWQVEDQLRHKEKRQEFDRAFIALARSVYQLNDERAALKRKINLQTNSPLIEQKSYG